MEKVTPLKYGRLKGPCQDSDASSDQKMTQTAPPAVQRHRSPRTYRWWLEDRGYVSFREVSKKNDGRIVEVLWFNFKSSNVLSIGPEAVARITVDNWLQKIQIASPSRLIYLLFPWTSFSAAWCPLGVSLWIFQHPCISVQGTKSRPRISGCLLRPWCVQSSPVFLVAPSCPPWLYCIFFWNPKLNCHFLGRNKACNPKSPCFYAYLQCWIRKKQTPCFFWVPFSSFFGQPTIWNRCPKKTGPRSVLSPQLKMHGICAQQWAKGSSSSLFSTTHIFTTATAYLRANSCICVILTHTLSIFAKKNDIFTYR